MGKGWGEEWTPCARSLEKHGSDEDRKPGKHHAGDRSVSMFKVMTEARSFL